MPWVCLAADVVGDVLLLSTECGMGGSLVADVVMITSMVSVSG